MEPLVQAFVLLILSSVYQMQLLSAAEQHLAMVTQRAVTKFLLRRRERRRRSQQRRFVAVYGFMLLHRQQARTTRANLRRRSWWEHIKDNWNDTDWQKNFRMKRVTFQRLCNILQPTLTRQSTNFRDSLSLDLRVAICLWRLATNLDYRSISDLFGVGISTACQITQEVVTAINKVMKRHYIRTPSDEELGVIVQGYRDKWGFPQVAGVIDRTHIGIQAPADNAPEYYNRKGFYSVLLQGVVCHKLRFWNINVGWPGNAQDAKVFANSPLYEQGQSGTLFSARTEQIEGVDVPPVILGDAAYPLLPWLMKPYPEGTNLTPANIQFNHRLSQARMTVKRAFGRLKGRWRCLLTRCDAHISLVSHIITACCVLHNFCEIHEEEWEDADLEADQSGDHNVHHTSDDEHGHNIRHAFCTSFSR
ncbi:uncharacterized protein LOC130905787 isoform X2 [Corythoichthys intestinalis]|uniref:uncharacterized protein LOC130905787 isoform X2 n=1 Tax=Corythoichthys intestinalis TaxID=161448 RepID=UPI0025A65C61|nr:uncharacterized protein LOC130905787 isoform X2 [Corythoichthys intestinalis]